MSYGTTIWRRLCQSRCVTCGTPYEGAGVQCDDCTYNRAAVTSPGLDKPPEDVQQSPA